MTGNLSTLMTEAAARLKDVSDSPRLDAELLMAHALGRERSYLLAHPEMQPETAEARRYGELVASRRRGEPIAYLTSKREFWSLPLMVTPATLIPRPETELLVQLALENIPQEDKLEVLDLGTGSGAIALALAKERPLSLITAVDENPEALKVATENARMLGIANVGFIEGDWFIPVLSRRFRVIVSNPPYVRDGDPRLGEGDLRHEPRAALAAGVDGLDDLRRIIREAPAYLDDGGTLFLEHGQDQAHAVRALLLAARFSQVQTWRDLSGHERVSGGEWVNRASSG